jgi:hypothetical protein
MKILICAFSYLPDKNGVAFAVDYHYKILKKLGHDVKIATGFNVNRNNSDYIFQFKVSGTGRIGNRFIGEKNEYIDFLVNGDFDYIFFHCWEIWSTELAIDAFDRIAAKKVIFSHGTSFDLFNLSFLGVLRFLTFLPYRLRFSKRIEKFDYYVFLTSSTQNGRFSDYKYIKNKSKKNYSIISNVTNLLPINSTIRFKEKFNIISSKLVICVANYQKIKRQKLVAKIFLDAKIEDCSLVFFGSEENDYYYELQRLYGNYPNIFFLQEISKQDIHLAYLDADAFLMFSETEAQPLVLLDCLATNLPFVSSNVGCIHEIEGGLTANTPQEASSLLRSVLLDSKLNLFLREAGKREFEEKYSHHLLKDKFIFLLNALLEL